ncbi:ATP-dependent helicase [Patescibacteria group bacterium]
MKEFVLKQNFDPSRCKIDYQTELNKEQLDVVLHGDGPCLVLAGAGSGKTRTITYRVAYLIEQGIAPDNILLVTFTNKAAQEMLSRVEGLLGSYPTGLWGGTFHSIANRILRIYADRVGRTPGFTILDQEDAKDLIKVCIKELNIDTKARRFPSPAKVHSIISYARNAAMSIPEVIEKRYSNFIDLIPVIDRLAQMYDSRKRQADSVDFDDLLILLRDLLYKDEGVRNRLATQFQYVLVDEYQDTNVIQAEIVSQLSSAHSNILVVGDDAQSIYSFRAAEIRNILNFSDVYGGVKTYHLTTNYRSTPEILSLANQTIAFNRDQFKKELKAVCDSCEKPNLIPTSNTAQEAQYVAEQLLELRDEGVDMTQMAVLFRAAYLSQSLEFELMKRDIPYEYRGGMKFFERAHIKDVVAHLRIMANIKDETAWMRVLGLQTGIGLVTAGKIIKSITEFDSIDEILAAEVKLGVRAKAGWEGFLRTGQAMAKGNRLPSDIIRAVITSSYRDYLEAEYPDFMERLEDLEQFAIFAEGYDDLHKLLDEVSLTEAFGAAREQGGPVDEERIVLSTIHQAKGLEWEAVFVIGLSEGKFPNERALEEDGGLEEERRLFYVAATRARKYLYLSYPMMSGYDTLVISQPSMFLTELPDDLLESVRLRQSITPPRISHDDFDSIIVLDDLGEIKKKTSPGSFLRGIDEL